MLRSPALLCLVVLAWTVPACAQTEIHRCIGANGSAVFTDQPCAALQATPVNPVVVPDRSAPLAAPPPVLCAASLGQLRKNVIDAFASRDANRMAGLMLWDGYGRGAAIADIRSLGDLMKQPLLDVDIPGDPVPADGGEPVPVMSSSSDPFAAAPAFPLPANNQLVLHITGNDGSGNPREIRFGIAHQAGCLWLRNVD
ncbi:DUF4124 domain-containing protein [Rhodanobacter glycinis]|uniref:DUF4124 domain-containing protein n=2 Tax=Rhodanobacter glycinis TaxID=582702 RepID=A0A502FDF8_9GAMM|nr:DUF4124 domain-containing protein [Rhodanobacter glycinis]TPG11753.1 DUF4124 domain-containing protein [Rhodanobacter glycinis]TPG47394.1 DUF4124 domain-containing protein [Rhodanobacter glycinis]